MKRKLAITHQSLLRPRLRLVDAKQWMNLTLKDINLIVSHPLASIILGISSSLFRIAK
jgi:hypothetical protein